MTYRPKGTTVAPRNFITNSTAEGAGVLRYSTYADSGATPSDGVGGSPTITWTQTTTDPLDDLGSFLFTKDAANRQGEGVMTTFSIQRADQGQVMQIEADVELVSGTYDSGTSTTNSDAIFYVIDTGNATTIEPVAMKIIPGGRCKATFQTASNSTTYRLCIHQSLTGTSAYVLKFDNITVSRQVTSTGYAASDWKSEGTITVTGVSSNPTKGTVVIDQLYSRRDGKDLLLKGIYRHSALGAAGSGAYLINLPSGMVIDTTVNPANTGVTTSQQASVGSRVGYMSLIVDGAFSGEAQLEVYSTTQLKARYIPDASAGSGFWGSGAGPFSSGNLGFTFEARVPIVGWSSNTVSSSETDTRDVLFVGYVPSNQALTANTTNLPITSVKDSHGAWNGTQYLVTVPGDYDFTALGSLTSGACGMLIYVGGVSSTKKVAQFGTTTTSGAVTLTNLKTGDLISFRADSGITVLGDNANSFTIKRRSGPSQITASQVIAFNVNTSSTAATTSAPFIFSNKVSDTHGAYSTSTGIFTAPSPGFYQFNWRAHCGATDARIDIYINGSQFACGSHTSTNNVGTGSLTVFLNTGQTAQIRPSTNATANGSAILNGFSGFRVGGVG